MNLQENYKRLFKGKARSNDASILFESPYKVKITKHETLKDSFLKLPYFEYNGTISGPDIPNGTTFEAKGIAGDVDNISALRKVLNFTPVTGDIITLQTSLSFPNSETSTSIVNPNELDNTDDGMTKEKKDELSKIIDDAIVKYALSKGLEDGVAEKSGGTFNTKAVMKKKKLKRTGSKIAVFDGEVDGRNRTASGTYGNKEWELTTDDGMTYIFVDGKSIDDDDPMYDDILTAVNDEGYEIDLDEGYLQENYKRIFKGRFK
jgi:hypothetical protein